MSAIDSAASTTTTAAAVQENSIENLDLDVFLDLMLTELQSQDPLDPMDNQEMINSISQIREIAANDQLTDTLESVLLGQNVSTAAAMVGQEVEGLTDDGRRVVGAVSHVVINDGEPRLEVAVETSADAGDDSGAIEPGAYSYEVLWEAEGALFGVQVGVDTEQLGDDFVGSIRLENLPETEEGVTRYVYRGKDGGDPQLVGTLTSSLTSAFTDTLSQSQLSEQTLTEPRTILRYADAETIRLSNIATIQTLD